MFGRFTTEVPLPAMVYQLPPTETPSSGLGAGYLAGNYVSLLNQAIAGAEVASCRNYNVVILLDVIVPIPIVLLELGLGNDVAVALL